MNLMDIEQDNLQHENFDFLCPDFEQNLPTEFIFPSETEISRDSPLNFQTFDANFLIPDALPSPDMHKFEGFGFLEPQTFFSSAPKGDESMMKEEDENDKGYDTPNGVMELNLSSEDEGCEEASFLRYGSIWEPCPSSTLPPTLQELSPQDQLDASMSPSMKAVLDRERKREHAKNARLRRKFFTNRLKSSLSDLRFHFPLLFFLNHFKSHRSNDNSMEESAFQSIHSSHEDMKRKVENLINNFLQVKRTFFNFFIFFLLIDQSGKFPKDVKVRFIQIIIIIISFILVVICSGLMAGGLDSSLEKVELEEVILREGKAVAQTTNGIITCRFNKVYPPSL